MASSPDVLQAKIDKMEVNIDRLNQFINDLTGTLMVAIDGGEIPSLYNAVNQVLATVPVKGYVTEAELLADAAPGFRTVAFAADTQIEYVKTQPAGVLGWVAAGTSLIATIQNAVNILDEETARLRSDITFPVGMGTDAEEMGWAITDENNVFGVGVGVSGQFHIGSDPGLVGSGGIKWIVGPDPNWPVALTDSGNQIAWGLKSDGTIYIHNLETGNDIAGGSSPLPDVLHIVGISQSNHAEGSEALPIASTGDATTWNAWVFSQGIRTWSPTYATNPVDRPAGMFELVPLQEAQNGGLGETVFYGMTRMLREMMVGRYTNLTRGSGPMLFCSAAVRGGRYLDELMPLDMRNPLATPEPDGTGYYYETMMDDIDRLITYCTANNLTYGIWFGYFAQGEAESGLNLYRGGPSLSVAAFDAGRKEMIINYWNRFNTDVAAKLGSRRFMGKVPLFTYQTAGNASGHVFNLVADSDPDIYEVGPSYYLANGVNSIYTSGTLRHGGRAHYTSDATRAFGVQVGKAVGRRMLYGVHWEPVKISFARKTGAREVICTIAGGVVDQKGITVDTSWITAQGAAMGLELLNSAGTSISITSVDQYDSNKVRITATADLLDVSYTVRIGSTSFAFTFTANLVTEFRDGAAFPNGKPSKEIVLSADDNTKLAVIKKEGAYLAQNTTGTASLVIREAYVSGGKTVLKGENTADDLSGTFAVGDTIHIYRMWPYSNIRDNDDEVSPLSFDQVDTRAERTGPYPLWNWLRTQRDIGVKMS